VIHAPESFDPVHDLMLAPRPRASQRAPDPPLLARVPRVVLLSALLLLHALALWWIDRYSRIAIERPRQARSTTLVFVTLPAGTRPTPPAVRRDDPQAHRAPSPRPRAPARVTSRAIATRAPRSAPPDPPAAAATQTPRRAELFRSDGSIALPPELLDELAGVTGTARRFSYQVPGALAARDFLQRPPALVYEATRFESAWIEEEDVVTEALQKVVEKTTATITIPIPRSPGSKIVCKVSLAALGGACGIVNNGEGYLVVLNDPDTLNAEEDRRCQAWWERIVAAKTPEDWRDALDQYEAQCRKPLLSTHALPQPEVEAAERARALAPAG
jgi:hypothetical protein